MCTRKTRITLHRGPSGAYFLNYGLVGEVSAVKRKSGISTSDVEIMITLTRKKFNDVPNGGRNIYVVVEGRRPYCWSCGAPFETVS